MSGYSGTPLVKKLGIKPGYRIYVKNPPCDYGELLDGMPDEVRVASRLRPGLDMVHLFTKSRKELESEVAKYRSRIKPAGMIWVSWPKKSSKVATDITEDTIREVILPMGLVDVKVCAVDETWSGLKVVIRKENRT